MSLILTTAIEKGGTGKTTTVVNLAALMAAEGKRVLVVDMDQQANTTYMPVSYTHLDVYKRQACGTHRTAPSSTGSR